MAIDYELVRGLERGLDQALREGRRPTGAYALEHCAAIFQEPASIAEETKDPEEVGEIERSKEGVEEAEHLKLVVSRFVLTVESHRLVLAKNT